MRVIYLKNVGNIKRGEVREVTEGHALNFLLPQGVVAKATSELIRKLQSESVSIIKEKKETVSAAWKMSEKIRGRKIEIKAKANEAGKLYASVSADEVKGALKRLGFDIGGATIEFSNHIKEAGEYKVGVDFGKGIKSFINVIVRV